MYNTTNTHTHTSHPHTGLAERKDGCFSMDRGVPFGESLGEVLGDDVESVKRMDPRLAEGEVNDACSGREGEDAKAASLRRRVRLIDEKSERKNRSKIKNWE